MVAVRRSQEQEGGQGLFAVRDVPPHTVVAFYNGVRLSTTDQEGTWSSGDCDYRIFVKGNTEDDQDHEDKLDIPAECRSLGKPSK